VDHAGDDKLLNQLLLSLLMLVRRFCVYNSGLKADAAREILAVIMTSNDKNVRLFKRHLRVLFLAIALPFLSVATHYLSHGIT